MSFNQTSQVQNEEFGPIQDGARSGSQLFETYQRRVRLGQKSLFYPMVMQAHLCYSIIIYLLILMYSLSSSIQFRVIIVRRTLVKNRSIKLVLHLKMAIKIIPLSSLSASTVMYRHQALVFCSPTMVAIMALKLAQLLPDNP